MPNAKEKPEATGASRETTGAPHEATWGMTEHGKREWDTKHGTRIRKETAVRDKEAEA